MLEGYALFMVAQAVNIGGDLSPSTVLSSPSGSRRAHAS
jgi:hypothetical protein